MRARAAGALAVFVVAVLVGACSGGGKSAAPTTVPTTAEETLPPDPSTSSTRPATTVSTVPRPPRTTTTVPVEMSPGSARIGGTVVGPLGPVAGANVRIERLVGSEVATASLVAANGQFSLPSVRGGNYRVRAWKTPDLVLLEPEVFFLGADETRNLDLRLTKVSDFNVTTSVEPDPPPAQDPFTVTIQVYAGTVTDQGALQGVSRPGLQAQLVLGSGIGLQGPDRAVTDPSGRAAFRVRCLAPGPVAADVILGAARVPLGLPACR